MGDLVLFGDVLSLCVGRLLLIRAQEIKGKTNWPVVCPALVFVKRAVHVEGKAMHTHLYSSPSLALNLIKLDIHGKDDVAPHL